MAAVFRLEVLLLSLLPGLISASELRIQAVSEGIWAIVGEHAQRSPDNLGNNATFGLIDTADGLVLVDPGGSYQGASKIDAAIRTVSAKPVVLVINSGGQDHRWLGNGYWQAKGARTLASTAAVADQRARARDQLLALQQMVGAAGMTGTEPVHADETFDDKLNLSIGGVPIELKHFGPAHTPGDTVIWLPTQRVLFSGDIVYTERMLGVGPQSNIKSWLAVFAALQKMPVQHLVPGHGNPTNLARAEQDTGRYLKALHDRVKQFIIDGGTLDAISQVDQSDFLYLTNADELAGRNAHQVYQQLEFDF